MEPDRFKINHKLFAIALVSMILSLIFFAMTIFIVPNLLFGWHYNAPTFIMAWREWLEFGYGYSDAVASKLIVLFFFGLAVVFAFIAYFSSNRIERVIYGNDFPLRKWRLTTQRMRSEGMFLTMKILFIILLVVMCAVLVSWFLSTPTIRNDTGINNTINPRATIVE